MSRKKTAPKPLTEEEESDRDFEYIEELGRLGDLYVDARRNRDHERSMLIYAQSIWVSAERRAFFLEQAEARRIATLAAQEQPKKRARAK